MYVFLFAACSSGADSDDDLPSGYVHADSADLTPDVTGEGAAAAVDAVLGAAFRYNAAVAFAAYDEMMVHGDGACPTLSQPGEGITQWETNCTATDGTVFAGYTSDLVAVDPSRVRRIRAEASITEPDGTRLVLAGDLATTQFNEPPTWTSEVDGVMAYDGPAAAGTWFEDGVAIALTTTLTASGTGAPNIIDLEGSVSALDGEISAVAFTDARFSRADDWPCPEEPSGTLSLRDADGVWIDLVFDVTEADDGETWEVADGACDGCGTLWLNAQTMGEVCIDAASLFDVETPPW